MKVTGRGWRAEREGGSKSTISLNSIYKRRKNKRKNPVNLIQNTNRERSLKEFAFF